MSAETYRGVPVPDRIRRDRDENRPYSVVFTAWREGVDAALGTGPLVGLIADFMDGAECDPDGDDTSSCREHGWFGTALCPHDRARKMIDTEAGAEG
jgi:hypothetical protein